MISDYETDAGFRSGGRPLGHRHYECATASRLTLKLEIICVWRVLLTDFTRFHSCSLQQVTVQSDRGPPNPVTRPFCTQTSRQRTIPTISAFNSIAISTKAAYEPATMSVSPATRL